MVHGNWLAKWKTLVGSKPAVVELETGRSLTYAALDERADRLAHALQDGFGVGPGERVAVLAQNRLEQVELYFAVAKLGAVLVPVNWRLTPPEVGYVLADSAPRVMFFGRELQAGVQALVDAGLWRGPLVDLDDPGPQGYAARLGAAAATPVEREGVLESTPLMLLYTSGTTGRPKGAVLTHGSITWNAINTATGWDLHQADVTLTHTPFFHTGGWNVLTLPLLHRGGTVVLARKFEAAEAVRAIERHGISVLFAVPTMFQMMLDCGELGRAELGSLRFFISGGAPCPVPLIEAYARLGVTFKQGYGLTEVGPNCFVLDAADAIRKAGSVGFPVLHLDTRLVAAEGRLAGPDEVGELQLRGPTVCAGYWQNPEATRQALSADGWFATGDLFRRDAEGYHYVVGRLKEMYISGGENVYPAEVERVLYEIPEVIEAAVVGVPDPKWGEVGFAFVATGRADRAGLSEARVLEHCREHLARYKVPKFLALLDTLPKGASGKIQKTELQAEARRRAGAAG
ncbi:MAG TPA: long-chain fatty acid--CoA ligase [Myxococcota bacterium]|nr:long-chain fatty acid--CoA ligase [Myxococcota bacterium]HRY95375.1 long-chain fatty acid--CoA ligase [Myxococcota bacterium]HSA21648.1 long-chain fatty acid--CoA ligase [Myxococcota bacterium]